MPILSNFPPGFPNPSNFSSFPPAFGNHTVQPPSGWLNGAGPTGNGDDTNHHPGPIRRGGGRFNGTTRPGPYDRRQGSSHRYGNNGRLTPPGARNGAGGGMRNASIGAGKWGDGAGAQTVGPKEAVQGRSIKSYEDLDAVAGSGGGELNY